MQASVVCVCVLQTRAAMAAAAAPPKPRRRDALRPFQAPMQRRSGDTMRTVTADGPRARLVPVRGLGGQCGRPLLWLAALAGIAQASWRHASQGTQPQYRAAKCTQDRITSVSRAGRSPMVPRWRVLYLRSNSVLSPGQPGYRASPCPLSRPLPSTTALPPAMSVHQASWCHGIPMVACLG